MRTNSHTFHGVSLAQLAIAVGLTIVFFLLPTAAWQQALDLDGSSKDPLKGADRKVVVLVFARTDCPISNRYAPLIQEMSVKFGGEATFWLVFPDKNESPVMIRGYLQDFGYKLPALRDPGHVLVKKSHVKVTPEVAVFNAKRELVYRGRIDNLYQDFGQARRSATTHELVDAIEAARKGLAPAAASADGIGCFIADLK